MEVKTERKDGALIASVDGRIDGGTAREFEYVMNAAIGEDDRAVVVDLSELSYISSAGLRAVLLVAKGLWKRDAKFSVCSPGQSITEVFEIAGFNEILRIHPSLPEAIAAASD